MKRVTSLFLSIVMLFSITAGIDFSAFAETYSGSCGANVVWSLDTSTGVLTISGTGDMTDYSDYSYGSSVPWHLHQSSIKEAIISSGVTNVGEDAFFGCTSLESITISNSVTSIGSYAFALCTILEEIIIPNSVTYIGRNAFEDCYQLKNVQIPYGVTSIEDDTFSGCDQLINVTIPDSVTCIGDYAFSCCESLTKIIIPDSVTNIGYGVFQKCTNLINIEIGNGLKSIGGDTGDAGIVFSRCTNLSNILVDSNNDYYSSINGVLFDKAETKLLFYPSGNNQETYNVPDTVNTICNHAFFYCNKLKNINICTNVICVEEYAFVRAYSIENISVDQYNINYSSKDGVLFDKTSKTLIQYPIGSGNLEYVIPNTVECIKERAFYECNLNNITIQNSIIYIGDFAFYNCTGLTDVYYAGSDTEWNNISIGSSNDSLTNATIHFNSSNNDSYWLDDSVVNYNNVCTTHTWNSGVVTKKATTSAAGAKKYTCTVCGATKTSSIAKISSVTLSSSTYTYDGKVKKPSVTVKNSNGSKISSSNYTVTYASGRKNIGEYKVTVKFKGNYSGTVTKTFKIAPKGTSITSVSSSKAGQLTVKWKKQSSNTNGYKIQYAKKSDFSDAKTVTINKNTTTSKTITGLSDGVKYYVRVCTYKTVSDKKICSSWSSNKSATVKVTATTLSSVESNPEAFTVHVKKPSKSVSGYVIQYSTDKNFKSNVKAKDISNNTVYTISGLKSQTTYYVRVKTYKTVNGTKKYSSYSKALSVLTRLKYPANIKVANSSATSLKLTWDKVSGAKGYEIYRSTSKSGTYKKIKSISKETTTSYTDKNLKTTTTYYYKIIALSSKNKNANSIKSSAVSCKTKYPASSYFKATISNYTYSGSAIMPEPTVKNSKTGKKLTKGTDYSLSYSNNTNAGTATVTITGKGNYYGTKKITFKINPKPLTSNDITVSGITETSGTYYPSTVKYGNVTLKKGTDYTYSTPTKVNDTTNSVKITFKGNYSGTVNKQYAINKYPSIEPIKIPRIVEAPNDNTCHFYSVASVEAYALGMEYSYGNISRTYEYGTDYQGSKTGSNGLDMGMGYELDPVVKKMFDLKGCDNVDPTTIFTLLPVPFKQVTNANNSETTYKAIYNILKQGKPVVIYASGNTYPHATVVIGCKANKTTVTADDLIVMEIVGSWKNSSTLLSNSLSNASKNGNDLSSCYMTLNAWLNYDNRTISYYSYPTEIR